MRGIRPGIFNGILTALAGLLLTLLLTGSAWALTATDCATCHGADIVEGHHDTTDPNSLFNQGKCESCHVGITTGNDCTTCHAPSGYTFNSHHLKQSGQTAINCAQCHTGAGDPKDCSGCHKGEVPREFHHTRLTAYRDTATGKLNCTVCHSGAQLTSDCKGCHDEGAAAYQTTHHDYVNPDTGSKPVCTSCHNQLKATTGRCQDCHAPRAKMAEHHALTGAPAYMSCTFCHTGLATGPKESRAGCNVCHSVANLPLHHDKVRTERSLACNQCHKTAVAVSGCESCHLTGATPTAKAIHHDTTAGSPYANGNCGACHTSTGYARSTCNSIACHPALSPTSGARHHRSDVITKYPVFQSSDNPSSADCNICHFYGYIYNPTINSYQLRIIPPAAEDCIFCHERTIGRGDLQLKHHNTTAATNGNCGACHSGVSTSGSACSTCHSATGTKPATPQTHHTTAAANGTPCATCHQGITTSSACSDCHTVTGGNDASRHHLFKNSQGQLYACESCHAGAGNIYQSCKGCHEKVRIEGTTTVVPSSTWHHMTTAYATGSCMTCHKTTDGSSLQKDCSYCHVGAGKAPIIDRHHATDSYLTGSCSACHVNTAAANISCAGCHTSTVTKHHSKTIIANNAIQPKPCKDCHSTIQLAGNSCAICHTLPMAEFHHDNGPEGPLTTVGGNCAVCHSTLNDPSVCANCHASSPHHTTTWSQTGDCAHCHAVPASAADRPAQAACRECHGSTMHDKGGPIQSFGACAACHNTTPFHAYNSGDTGSTWNYSRDDRNRGGSGPGYGKFNMFVSQNSRRGEEGREAPRTKLNFSTKQISHEGKSYTVPYFTGMPSSNLALSKTASASRAESGYSATLAVDGNTSSRWWAKSTSTQWLKVDLGSTKTVSKVALRWHSYYARSYQIQVSTDNSTWTTVFSNAYGAGGMETRTFTARSVRYIRINCQTAASSNGYSIYELEAYAQ